ncbi:metallophosphoesterase family protein [Halosolutus gelatinilyticus]|uniref:metallophosphoesterase family protein n=1 Tax=Halosolutus gelatinilyticus TaxID=2931975 RepID=UPI001FF123D0|nr:metallophosphoesterase [Halosolutus gelatinilyticus]
MLVLGDAHASDPDRRETLRSYYRALDPDRVLQVGDLECYDLPAPTWFVAGNNEDFDVIEALRAGDDPPETRNVHLLASTAATVGGLRVAGLSGNFAPTKYDLPRTELSGDRRRHFTRKDVDRAADLSDVDVFLAHEAPTGLLSYGYDPGCQHVNDLLEAVSPDLCLVGHHHKHREETIADTRVVSLDPAWERYYTLDPGTLELTGHDQEAIE